MRAPFSLEILQAGAVQGLKVGCLSHHAVLLSGGGYSGGPAVVHRGKGLGDGLHLSVRHQQPGGRLQKTGP